MYKSHSSIGAIVVLLCVFCVCAQATEVKFSATADSRGAAGFSLALDAINSVAGGPGEFHITPGDIDPPATTRADLDAAFGAGFPWYPNVGNHETETPDDMVYLRQYYWDNLDGNVNPGPASTVETTYSFDAGPVHIAVINEYWDGSSDVALYGDVIPELLAWLQADLAASDKPWKLVFGHEPAYPWPDEDHGTSRHVGDSLDAYPANRDAFWQMLEDEGAVAYVCGHTHRFSHIQPNGGSVWQIDCAQARGASILDTFVIFTADETQIKFDVYRSLVGNVFALTDTWTETYLPPATANAGEDIFGYESRDAGAYVCQLDGSASVNASTYAWEQTAGVAVALDDPASVVPSFDAPQWDGTTELLLADAALAFRLTVNQGQTNEDTDEVACYVRIPGDANGDDVVNAFDLALLRQLDAGADFNGDGGVNAFDLAILRVSSGRRRLE